MLCPNLRKKITAALISVSLLIAISPSALAAEPHQNPKTAEAEFNDISLLRYYYVSLDLLLQKTPKEVEARLKKMPLANIPTRLKPTTEDFASSGIRLSYLVVQIDQELNILITLVGQFRLDEATKLATQISDNLSQANHELERIEQVTKITSEELDVSSAPVGSDLRILYDGAIERINRIQKLLDDDQDLLTELSLNADLFEPTEITLEIEPTASFVGDNISFVGILTSENKSLAEREIKILVNGFRYVTARTDADGRYQGNLPVPYWYLPELYLQALYHPQAKDIGVYLGSLSPATRLQTLFYQSKLEITVEEHAYLGVETTISGRFDYTQSPLANDRRIEIYLDDSIIAESSVPEVFAQKIPIYTKTNLGKHIITVFSPAAERYSSANTSAVLNVTFVYPTIDLDIPPVVITLASFNLKGKVSSEIGSLNEAMVEMGMGGAQVTAVTAADGSFDTKLETGTAFGLIGSQDLVIKVTPQEPGSAPLTFTTKVIVVNPMNLGILLLMLLFLGIYLRRRLRRASAHPGRMRTPAIAPAGPTPISHNNQFMPELSVAEGRPENEEPRNVIFYCYRLVLRAVQAITQALLKPQQTLREFAKETSKVLGPTAQYFIELTKMVERLLYSQYQPTEADAKSSQQLSLRLGEEVKTETALLSFGIDGRQIRMAIDQADDRVLMTSPRRRPATWLWGLLKGKSGGGKK